MNGHHNSLTQSNTKKAMLFSSYLSLNFKNSTEFSSYYKKQIHKSTISLMKKKRYIVVYGVDGQASIYSFRQTCIGDEREDINTFLFNPMKTYNVFSIDDYLDKYFDGRSSNLAERMPRNKVLTPKSGLKKLNIATLSMWRSRGYMIVDVEPNKIVYSISFRSKAPDTIYI